MQKIKPREELKVYLKAKNWGSQAGMFTGPE
jgi:hypothetical protein